MAYDEQLAERIRTALASRPNITEKRMFGGLAFLSDGKMFCGLTRDDLMVRVGPEAYEAALKAPHVRPMDFTGRPLKGYVFVANRGLRTSRALQRWIDTGANFVATLKTTGPRPRSKTPPVKPAPATTSGKRRARMNSAWHERHPMPPKPTLQQRLRWHEQHAKHCACRPIPAKLRALLGVNA